MLFSINCLTYKRTELLEEAVQSVLQQTCKDWELLIVNDCADQSIIFNHPQVKVFNLNDKFKTIGEKRNFGIRQSSGELVIQLDDDDLFLPDYLSNLASIIEKSDWLMAQRPLLYYDDTDKVILSPVPQFNTFLYRRESVFRKVNYPNLNYDELTPFYRTVTEKSLGLNGVYKQLRPAQCGYIYRQNVSESKKYKMSDFKKESVEEQNKILSNLPTESGEVKLNPVWRKDYSVIVKHNMEILPVSSYKPMSELEKFIISSLDEGRKEPNIWEPVKPSWANAMRFISAVKSRGIISTALNVTGINKTLGDRVSDEVLAQRRLSCFGVPEKLIAPCTRLRVYKSPNKTQAYYCGGCGCGKNELARLDGDNPDDYTKLHYPYLECPLQRPGFSNQKDNILTVVITALNETPEMLNSTIKSIRNTSNEVEIIVVDDCSDSFVKTEDTSVRIVRNEKRVGCAQSRHKGALLAKNKYLLFTDSHMIFAPGWYDEFKRYANKEKENVAFCGVCLGLDSKHTTLEEYCGRYNGARLALYEEKENQVLEGKWIDERDGESYEISCMMGAIYIINKDYFFKLRGLSDLKMWGSDEPCLALKILLSGGKMMLVKGIQAGHFFRDAAPYSTGLDFLVYNKIRMALTMLPDELSTKLIDRIPKDGDFFSAMNMIENEKDLIEEYKSYYKSIFTKDIYDISRQFDIHTP